MPALMIRWLTAMVWNRVTPSITYLLAAGKNHRALTGEHEVAVVALDLSAAHGWLRTRRRGSKPLHISWLGGGTCHSRAYLQVQAMRKRLVEPLGET